MNRALSNRLANGKVRSKPNRLVPITKHEHSDMSDVFLWKDFQLRDVIPLDECLCLVCLKFVKLQSSQNSDLS